MSGAGGGTSPTATTSTGGSPTATPSGSGTPDAGAPPFFFTVRATASNSVGDYTIIDNVVSNGDPNLALFVTANWNPNGSGGVYDDHALGVYYIGSPTNKWAIYHQDTTPYTPNASYNVYATNADGTSRFVQHACAAACVGDFITVNSSASNGKPGAIVFTTANWNPGGLGGVYDNHHLGVFYANNYHQWAIYHQDKAAYIANSSFNVVIPQPGE